MATTILADSACDLSEHYYNEYNIEMIPLTVHLDDKEYRDSIDIHPKTIYDAMREGHGPKTSQASAKQFKEIFTSYAEAKKPLLYIAFSSELSGTYQAAKMVEQEIKEAYPDAQLHIVDSKCASLGYGLVVLAAAKMTQQQLTFDEIAEQTSKNAAKMEHIFTVDNLEYLYRGGRVSKTAAFVGGLLNIKPLLHVADGKLVPLEKIRGSKKVLKRMIDVMDKRGENLENQVIGISHGDDLPRAKELSKMIQDRFGVKEENIVIEMVGSVIGAHSGPGTLALFFYNQ
ncbi:DegV family protein [Oceanobacillus sp. J11TS1]|uniref:DegV family protein n=1 Tax=Oceanobacillus sp. J11TS1 TaxID=2807191 RepID=UPI001B182099|nr:DegV family protein [Oceanobacillus sp. J11TS1]GIO24441.1 DegV domain-containing protein YitS [Oceanobacillus sp. J11TS1]